MCNVCVRGVSKYYCLSELNVKHDCVNRPGDGNDESSHQQAEGPQLPPSSKHNLRRKSDSPTVLLNVHHRFYLSLYAAGKNYFIVLQYACLIAEFLIKVLNL